jgi:hypothetical protein
MSGPDVALTLLMPGAVWASASVCDETVMRGHTSGGVFAAADEDGEE